MLTIAIMRTNPTIPVIRGATMLFFLGRGVSVLLGCGVSVLLGCGVSVLLGNGVLDESGIFTGSAVVVLLLSGTELIDVTVLVTGSVAVWVVRSDPCVVEGLIDANVVSTRVLLKLLCDSIVVAVKMKPTELLVVPV